MTRNIGRKGVNSCFCFLFLNFIVDFMLVHKSFFTITMQTYMPTTMQFMLSISAFTTLCKPYGPRREKTSIGFTNNQGADKPALLRSLISAFVICSLVSITS